MASVTSEELVPPAHVPPPALEASAPSRSQTVLIACAISVAAGVIHAVAMVDHFSHYWLFGVFFLIVTYFQVLWAIWLYRRPDDRRVLRAGVIASLAISAVWLISRTVGLPFGPNAGSPERVGALDIVATLDQLVLAAFIMTLVASDGRIARRAGWLAGAAALRLSIMLCSASVFAILLGGHHH